MRVLVADPLSDAGVGELASHFDVDVRTGLPKDELIDAIGDYDAVVVRSATQLDADVLAAAGRLKVIARAGIGLDNVDVETATERGIIVCNAPRSNVISAAEHTIALLLALARDVPRAHAHLSDGRWERDAHKGVELHNKTLGVVGLGRVGQLVAQRCLAFGMKLIAYDPFITPDRAARLGATLIDDIDELCRDADVITVHLPKTDGTVGLIGEEQLRIMKPTALLMNTSRGGLVDEDALHTALAEGWIAGAGLDVFVEEPATDSPLIKLDNAVVTPHLGASTHEAQDRAGTTAADDIRRALDGELVPNAVNLPVDASVPARVQPFLPLGERLGRLFSALSETAPSDVRVEFQGKLAKEDTEALTLSVLCGLVSDGWDEPVTFVNATQVAEERGLKLSTADVHEPHELVSLVRITAGALTLAATLVGATGQERLVEAWGFDVDLHLTDHLLFLRYQDRPGVVGVVGRELGDAGVNVAAMQVARQESEGDALMVLGIDEPAPEGVLADMASTIGANKVQQVALGP